MDASTAAGGGSGKTMSTVADTAGGRGKVKFSSTQISPPPSVDGFFFTTLIPPEEVTTRKALIRRGVDGMNDTIALVGVAGQSEPISLRQRDTRNQTGPGHAS